MYEAILTFLGVLVGAGIALLGTYLTVRSNSKLEISKMKLSYLMDKRALIEGFLNSSSYDLSGDMEQDLYMIEEEYSRLHKFLRTKSHYFLDSEYCDKCLTNISEIENSKGESPLHLAFLMRDVDNLFHDFLSEELITTSTKIEKIID